MAFRALGIRIPEDLLKLLDLYSQDQRVDRSTAIRQWLYQAAEEYAVRLVSDGRLSIGRAAELLDLSHFDIYRIAQAKGIELGGTEEQYNASMQYAARLKPRVRN